MYNKRVVITGMGVYTPNGKTTDELFNNLLNGTSSVRNIIQERPEIQQCNSHVASIFKEEDLTLNALGLNGVKEAKVRMVHPTRVVLNAAIEAVNQSGIFESTNSHIQERTGCAIASGFGGISEIEANAIAAKNDVPLRGREGLAKIDNFLAIKSLPGASPAYIGRYFNIHGGEFISTASACTSGLSAIIYGYDKITLGKLDAAIIGGTGDASDISIGAFDALRALSSSWNDSPQHASRPNAKGRDGFVFGDGAGALVLEEYDHAKKRGAPILCEILGYGATGDGMSGSLTAPNKEGLYATQAVKQALNHAQINPQDIDYINLHGTSTLINDPLECMVLQQALGSTVAKNIYANATKSMMGHTLNACGVLETIVSIMSMQQNMLHPNKNLEEPDYDDLPLKFVPANEPVEYATNNVLKTGFGFGGRNSAIIYGKV